MNSCRRSAYLFFNKVLTSSVEFQLLQVPEDPIWLFTMLQNIKITKTKVLVCTATNVLAFKIL